MYMKGLCENVKGAWDWLFHEHISRRIMAVFVIFFLISFFLTYSLYSWAARKQEDSMIEQSSVQMVTGVRNNLDEMVLNVNDDFNMLLKGGTLDVVNHLPRPEDRKTYDNMLFTALDSNHYLESIYLLDFSAHLYGVDKHDMKRLSVDSTLKCPWYRKALEAGGSYILEYEAGGIFYKRYNSRFVSVIRTINSLETQKPQGFIIMNIPTDAIAEICSAAAYGSQAMIGIMDQDGNLIAGTPGFEYQDFLKTPAGSSDEEKLLVSRKGDGEHTTSLYLPDYGWHLIARIPSQVNRSAFKDLFLIATLIFLVNVVLMLFGSLYISNSISYTIYALIGMMNTVKDRNFRKIPVKYPKSEIGILQTNYNNMVDEISSLLSRLVEEQKIKEKAELHALFEQVKPHFLYNTLDAIGYMALTEEPSQTYEAIETLGSFYRQSLSQGDQMITVEKETAIVNDYVKLLRLRYGDLFDVEYQVDESCLRVLVPHLILQPLVENAVYHGIKPMGGNGHIRIWIGPEEGGRMKIQVRDNGVGIDASALSKLQDYHKIWNIDIDVSGTGIGLIGTIQRIVLIYGEQASYQIRSVPEGGTEITFLLPVTCGGEEDHGDWI